MTKEPGLKVWLQQVGREAGWHCFWSPRSVAEHRLPGLFVMSVGPCLPRSSRAPCTRGTAEDRSPGQALLSPCTRRGAARITRTRPRSYSCKGPGAHADQQAWLLVLLKAELTFRLQHGGTGMRISCSIVSLLTDMNNDLPQKSWGVFWAAL